MTSYAAHIVTADAHGRGDPAIVVMLRATDPIANYSLKAGDEPLDVLKENGWCAVGDPAEVEPGYTVVDIEALPITPVPVVSTISTWTSLDSWEPIELINERIDLADADPAEGLEIYLREQDQPAGEYRLEWAEIDGPGTAKVEGHWDGETLTIDEAKGLECDD